MSLPRSRIQCARDTSFAGRDSVVPAELVNTARKAWPSANTSPGVSVAVNVNVVVVAPGMSVHGPNRSGAICHWIAGTGEPLAAAANDASDPASGTSAISGSAVTDGGASPRADRPEGATRNDTNTIARIEALRSAVGVIPAIGRDARIPFGRERRTQDGRRSSGKSHELIAMVAPCPLFLSVDVGADPVYRLLGNKGPGHDGVPEVETV